MKIICYSYINQALLKHAGSGFPETILQPAQCKRETAG